MDSAPRTDMMKIFTDARLKETIGNERHVSTSHVKLPYGLFARLLMRMQTTRLSKSTSYGCLAGAHRSRYHKDQATTNHSC